MAHRKVNVDQYADEDIFVDENQTAQGSTAVSAQTEAEVEARAGEVRNYLSRGDTPAAVIKALENPPAGREVTAVKDKNTATVMSALAAARSTDILSIVKSLDSKQTDVLMKYIYRGMASPELYNSAVLLAWHEKTVEVAGLGSIVRVLTDRRTV
ncbi:Actin- protein 2/3 complex subunit 5 [Geranomyces variabilis]|nr:Actin- protein 2/3 complex subunit 5 [Geranomyces variabilis]KAJ3154339.1 Actin- protein 2/3 complex subunit 5 [Geranomyces variabilis]KAJ3173193.1 Actin- protein 2/3 complex subunit 5 [Geranomyces variabilis]